jgi:hypothetical protein
MGFFDRSKPPKKPARRTTSDQSKHAGAVEYEARRHDRRAETLEAQGDLAGAQAERELAASMRAEVER